VSIVRSRKRCRRKDSQRRGRNIAVDDISSYSAFNHDIPEHDRIAYRGKVTADWRQQLDATKSWHGGQQLGAITTPTTSTSPAHAVRLSPDHIIPPHPHTHTRKHGFISGAVQPTGVRRGRPNRGGAARAVRQHPRTFSQVCPAASRAGRVYTRFPDFIY
jgi:hypothetical protein